MRIGGSMSRWIIVLVVALGAVLAGCGVQTSSDDDYVSTCTDVWPISQSDCQQIVRASRVCPDGDRNEFLMSAQGSYAVGGFTLGDAIDNAETMFCSPAGIASAAPTTTRSPTTTTRSPTTTTRPPTTTTRSPTTDVRWDREDKDDFMDRCIRIGVKPQANSFCVGLTEFLQNLVDAGISADELDCVIDVFYSMSAAGFDTDEDEEAEFRRDIEDCVTTIDVWD
jgi:hypothetical protein